MAKPFQQAGSSCEPARGAPNATYHVNCTMGGATTAITVPNVNAKTGKIAGASNGDCDDLAAPESITAHSGRNDTQMEAEAYCDEAIEAIRAVKSSIHRCSSSLETSNNIALIWLDFWDTGSMCGVSKEPKPMDTLAAELTIKAYLTEVRTRLDRVAGIARAADACAGAGFCDKAVEITLDIEQPLYEVTTLLNAASLINRISKET
jgi:hypothetical protein